MTVRSASRDQYVVVVAAFVAMLAPGALYSYSLLAAALARAGVLSHVATTVPFAGANFALGLGAVFGGRWMGRISPRTGATAGALLWGCGNLLAAFGGGSAVALALGYGAIGGFGCGLIYISVLTAIDTSFSRRRGLAFGIAVCGFGCGAPLFSKIIAGSLGGGGVALAHAVFGILIAGGMAFALVGVLAAAYLPASGDRTARDRVAATDPVRGRSIALLWVMLFVNALAGLVVIGNALPLVGDLLHASPAVSSEIFATLSLANAIGRLVGGAFCDRFGGAVAFRTLFALQVVAFLTLSYATTPAAIVSALATILMCYGGGFGAMPGLCRTTVGERFSAVYGVLLTAWGCAGIAGLWLSTSLRAFTASFAEAVTPIALLLAVALLLPSMLEVSARPDLLADPS